MKLDKSDALLVHSTIFCYVNTSTTLTDETYADLVDLQERVRDYLVKDESNVDNDNAADRATCAGCDYHDNSEDDLDDDGDEDDEDEDEDEYEEEEDEDSGPIIEGKVSCQVAANLPPITVFSPDGSKVSLEFEDVGDGDTVDALLSDGTVIIDSIECVVLTNQNVALFDGEEWHDFKVKKDSKTWKRAFPHGKTIGFSEGEET